MAETTAVTGLTQPAEAQGASQGCLARDFMAFVEPIEAGRNRLNLLVDGVHCGGCVRRIEGALTKLPEVTSARVNLSTRRLNVTWDGAPGLAQTLVAAVEDLGFTAVPFVRQQLESRDRRAESELLGAMAVAGFAAGNVMLLSVSVWAGYFEGMGPATRDLLHWFSALIALPAIVYAGRPFYRSALAALTARRTNMDVPISLAVLLAGGMSLFETIQGGRYVYFDSAVALLFFLLLGRYLDCRARGRARAAVERPLALTVSSVTVLRADGRRSVLTPDRLRPGMHFLAAAGERIAADGRVTAGRSELDTSLITGESLPRPVAGGDPVFAGTLNLGAPLTVEVTAVGEGTLLAEIVRLMENAEQRRARYVALADRISRFYAPAVHGLALATFLGWALAVGAPWQVALLHAVAVLIITCPCAMGLAVPVVQMIASGRLLRQGALLKSGTALERLAVVDTVVFDKTGTLTLGRPRLCSEGHDADTLRLAASLAGASLHPLARALSAAAPDVPVAPGVREVPGCGLALKAEGGDICLGSRRWCGIGEDVLAPQLSPAPELWLTGPGRSPQPFQFEDPLRTDAADVVAALRRQGLAVRLLSGDREAAVAEVVRVLGIEDWRAACSPSDKVAELERLRAAGRSVLMVGDGLNDAPALAAANVSLSPSSAADITQTSADVVFQGDKLAPVLEILAVARASQALVKQNFGLSFGYNVLTVPLAVLGLVTPLIAALCMSASSLVVIGNALRLNWRPRPRLGRPDPSLPS